MINDIFYFITDSEKAKIKEMVEPFKDSQFTILKRIDSHEDSFSEKIIILNRDNDKVSEFKTDKFTHLVLDRAYVVSKDRLN